MNKHIKTLALLSSITLVSACSHFHSKDAAKTEEKKCPVVEHLTKAAATSASTTAELKEAVTNAKDAAVKKRLNKLVAESDKLAKNIDNNKKLCEVKHDDAAKPAAKKHVAKAKKAAAVTPATDAPAAAAAHPQAK